MKDSEVLKNLIQIRKSSYPKDFSTEEISIDELNEVLNSAEFAPNHKKTKPWRFQVFKNDSKIELGEELMKVYKNSIENSTEKKLQSIEEKFLKSDAVVSISVNFSGKIPEWEEIAATSMAVQNMYLTCTALEIGCYWSSPSYLEKMEKHIGLEENQRCIGLFYMGKLKK